MKIQEILAIVGAISPVLLLVIGALLKRRADKAVEEKTRAEAVVAEATANRTRAETDSIFLTNAVKLVDEFKKNQAEKDAIYTEKLATSKEKIAGLESRVNRMEEGFSRLRAALATHGVWDAAALVDLRATKPEYPQPPPLPESLEEPDVRPQA